MNKLTKRTVLFALMLVLVMSLIMPTMVNATGEDPELTVTKIDTVKVTVTAPEVGTKLVDEETPSPIVTVPDDANYYVSWAMYIDGLPSKCETYDAGEVYGTTVADGETYYLEVFLTPKDGYLFDISLTEDSQVKNNVTLSLSGSDKYELGYLADTQYAFFTQVVAKASSNEETATTEETAATETTETTETAATTEEVATTPTAYEVLEGKEQTVAQGDELSFRFDIEYAKFQEDGKVYIDGELVDSSNYTTKEGSTIVTFTKDYTKKLAVGKHTAKVTVADGEASVEFSMKKASSNPKTGDNFAMLLSIFTISAVAVVATVKVSKKTK